MLRAATARTMLPTSMNMARRFNMRHYRTSLRTSGKRQATHRQAAAPVCELWARAPNNMVALVRALEDARMSSSPRTKTKGPEGVANGQDQSAQPYRLHVGSRVRTRRMMLGMSQEKLGDALGLTFQQVQKYEKGANRMGSSRLQQAADSLGVAVPFFFEGATGGTLSRASRLPKWGSVLNSLSTGQLVGAEHPTGWLGSWNSN